MQGCRGGEGGVKNRRGSSLEDNRGVKSGLSTFPAIKVPVYIERIVEIPVERIIEV